MNLYIAEPSEIVRSQLRDEEHLNYLELAISTTIRQLFGRSGLALTSKWNSLFAKAVYYTITTGMGVQTLGEEYLGLIQMDGSSSRFVASDLKRFLFIIIECIQNIILHNICKKLSWCGKKLRESNHINPALYVISQELPSMSDALIEYLKAFNIAVFYIFGTPYHQISKAITDIQYRSVRSQSNTEAQKLYRVLGILSLIRLLVIGRRRINHYLQEAGTSRLTAECEFEYSNINQTVSLEIS